MKKDSYLFTLMLIIAAGSCSKEELPEVVELEQEEVAEVENEYSDWTETTDGKIDNPNYSIVFNQNKVQRF
jgi:hypothetical protein